MVQTGCSSCECRERNGNIASARGDDSIPAYTAGPLLGLWPKGWALNAEQLQLHCREFAAYLCVPNHLESVAAAGEKKWRPKATIR
jgi:hypothetical protein